MRWTLTDGHDWAKRFDETVMEWMLDEPSDVVRLTDHPDYPEAVPTPEHFIPLLHLAGLASQDGDALDVLVGRCVFGSISVTAYTLESPPWMRPVWLLRLLSRSTCHQTSRISDDRETLAISTRAMIRSFRSLVLDQIDQRSPGCPCAQLHPMTLLVRPVLRVSNRELPSRRSGPW